MAQTQTVAEALKKSEPGLRVSLVSKLTQGDRILNKPLLEFGGKGVFVMELQEALVKGEIDFAVHSAKDLPMELEAGLGIAAVPKREDPRDVLVTAAGRDLNDKAEIVIGTSSLRRQLQIKELGKTMWPGRTIRCENIRGNVGTRLGKLDEGLYDGIILAAAGLKRLHLVCPPAGEFRERFEMDGNHAFHYFDCETFIPAGGQGILAVEGRLDGGLNRLAAQIEDEEARACLELERMILKRLDAGCHEPIGVYSRFAGGGIEVFGISKREGKTRRIHMTDSPKRLEWLARLVAKGLR